MKFSFLLGKIRVFIVIVLHQVTTRNMARKRPVNVQKKKKMAFFLLVMSELFYTPPYAGALKIRGFRTFEET
jgi:hypothetical protein